MELSFRRGERDAAGQGITLPKALQSDSSDPVEAFGFVLVRRSKEPSVVIREMLSEFIRDYGWD